ncbi:MAG: glycosyltransferase [Candidatus Anammoxibacter sp.]
MSDIKKPFNDRPTPTVSESFEYPKKIRVLGIIRDNGACGFYRIKQPLTKVQEQDLVDVALWQPDSKRGEDALFELAEEADVFIIPRVMGPEWVDIIKAWQKEGKKIIIDHDDDIFNVSLFSQHYIDSDTMEAAKECLGLADTITVTTDVLRQVYQKYNENVFVLPNCVDLSIWDQPEMVKNGNIRVSLHGGFYDYENWLTIQKPLEKIMCRYPNITLVLTGFCSDEMLQGIDEKQVEHHTWVSAAAHPYKQALLNSDIAIVPLKDTGVNRCHPIKYVEYSALKTPSVVSGTPPYPSIINDGENGCLFNSESEFIDKLTYLIENEGVREQIGTAAYENVKSNFDADGQAFQWANVINRCIKNVIKSPNNVLFSSDFQEMKNKFIENITYN